MQIAHSIDVNREPVKCLSFAPNSKLLAAGTTECTLDFYSVHENYKRKATLKKFHGPVTHLDWSVDSGTLQINTEAQELVFIDVAKYQQITQIEHSFALRNESWSSLNCVYGWGSQGCWKDHMMSSTDIKMVDRSNGQFYKEYQALAVAEQSGSLKIYKYPCTQPDSVPVVGKGHNSFISKVKWSANDKHIITTGGEDQTIILWRVEMNE
jgi:WD40 repeat protein